jgi:hypothetical protein
LHDRPISFSLALIFMMLNMLIWLAFGLVIALHAHPALPDDPFLQGGMAILAFCAAGTLLVLFVFLCKR